MSIENIGGSGQFESVNRLGDIEVERRPDGSITRINEVIVGEADKIVIVQRHQRPEPFSKDDLIHSSAEADRPVTNLDYVYDPSSTSESADAERQLLSETANAFGDMDVVATTPRKRGSEHKVLLSEQFAAAQQDELTDQLLDDSGLGLLGESFYGGHKYSTKEAELFKANLGKELAFGRKLDSGERKPFTYNETWVGLGYQDSESKWKIENPEELAVRTQALLESTEDKNFFITHEANAMIFHLLAARDEDDLRQFVASLELPEPTRTQVETGLGDAKTYLDVYRLTKNLLQEHPVKGFHYKKGLIAVLDAARLKSGEGGKGYGAVSVYVLKEEDGESELVEAAYDRQG